MRSCKNQWGKTACHCKNRISALYTTIGHSFKSVDSSWLFFGNYSFAKGKLTQPHRTILKEFLLENKKEVIDMVFFEYDAEMEKGSPSWTALWFLHNAYRYGSFLLGNNLLSA